MKNLNRFFLLALLFLIVGLTLYGQSDSLENELKAALTKIDELEAEIEKRPVIDWVTALISALIAGLVVFSIQRGTKSELAAKVKELELNAKESFKKVANENEVNVNAMVKQARLEVDVKKNTPFRVVGNPFTNSRLYQVMAETSFLLENEVVEGEEFKVLIVNFEGVPPKKDRTDFSMFSEVLPVCENLKHDQVIFYFNDLGLHFPTPQLSKHQRHKVNFATNASQIYGNLVNSLIYQRTLSKL